MGVMSEYGEVDDACGIDVMNRVLVMVKVKKCTLTMADQSNKYYTMQVQNTGGQKYWLTSISGQCINKCVRSKIMGNMNKNVPNSESPPPLPSPHLSLCCIFIQ